LRQEGHDLVQTHPEYPALKTTDEEVNNYNRWSHVNEVSKDNILTSLTPELYTELQDFDLASNMLEFLEAKFGEQYFIPKQVTNTEMTNVFSIQSEVLKLKELGLLDAEVNDQHRVDEILRSVIHSFSEFRRMYKGKEVGSSSELIRVVADSMKEPESGMDIGETFFSKPKGEEEKEETKNNGKTIVIGVKKAQRKSNGKPKGICFNCNENGHWMRNCPKYLAIKRSGKVFFFGYMHVLV
jgi:hypothetical protein